MINIHKFKPELVKTEKGDAESIEVVKRVLEPKTTDLIGDEGTKGTLCPLSAVLE